MLLLSLGQTLGNFWAYVNNVTGGATAFAVAHPYITWFLLGVLGWKLLIWFTPAKLFKKVSKSERFILMIVLSITVGPLILVSSLIVIISYKILSHVWTD